MALLSLLSHSTAVHCAILPNSLLIKQTLTVHLTHWSYKYDSLQPPNLLYSGTTEDDRHQPAALKRRWSSWLTTTKQTETVQPAMVWMKQQNHLWLHYSTCNRSCVSELNSTCTGSFRPAALNTGVLDLFMLKNTILSIFSGYRLGRNFNFKRSQSTLKISSLGDLSWYRKRSIQLNSLCTFLELGHTIQGGRVPTVLLLPWHWELMWFATSAGKRCS